MRSSVHSNALFTRERYNAHKPARHTTLYSDE